MGWKAFTSIAQLLLPYPQEVLGLQLNNPSTKQKTENLSSSP
jgi:hypothetical protein